MYPCKYVCVCVIAVCMLINLRLLVSDMLHHCVKQDIRSMPDPVDFVYRQGSGIDFTVNLLIQISHKVDGEPGFEVLVLLEEGVPVDVVGAPQIVV